MIALMHIIKKDALPEAAMAITSSDILNLSHSLKDICEVNCNTPECLSQALKILLQYNLIQANLQFSRQFEACSALAIPTPSPHKPPGQLDIKDPFQADKEVQLRNVKRLFKKYEKIF